MGRTRLVRADDESPSASLLREILTVVTGPVVMLAEELGRIVGIGSAFPYGSCAARLLGDAGPAPHDSDVMVLGEPDVDAVYEACTGVEATVHRPVDPTVLTPAVAALQVGRESRRRPATTTDHRTSRGRAGPSSEPPSGGRSACPCVVGRLPAGNSAARTTVASR